MKTHKSKLFVLLACAVLYMPHFCVGAQAEAALEEPIRAAVDAEGTKYFELREKILARGETARPALQAATQWDRPEARVIAQALLKWLDEKNGSEIRRGSDPIYKDLIAYPGGASLHQVAAGAEQRIASGHCYLKIGYRVSLALTRAGGWESSLLSQFNYYAMQGDENIRKYWPHDVYLLELALKGYTPGFLNVMGTPMTASRIEFHRMCAAAAAGVSPCTNTVAVLTLLLDVKHPPRVRQGALAGLAAIWVRASKAAGVGMPEDIRCIPTLDKVLDDPDQYVRLRAYGILTLLTEGNLGIDLVGRSRNLSPEDVQLIREHLAKWQAEQIKKTEGDVAPAKQGGTNEATPTPPPEPAPKP